MKKALVIFGISSLLIMICNQSNGQTIYGSSGLVKIPDAYSIGSGKAMVGVGYIRDYINDNPMLFKQYIMFFNFGFHSRFDIGFRLEGSREFKDHLRTGRSTIDRMINLKYVALKEKKYMPQFAIGVQDAVGTRKFNSTYVVISKSIATDSIITLHPSIGYGVKTNFLFPKKAHNHRFIGFFGGLEVDIYKMFYLSVEYDAQEFHSGISFKLNNWLFAKVFVTDLKNIGQNNLKDAGATISCKFGI